MSDSHFVLGKRGELAARMFYESRGAKILQCNWRCQSGEVDLIALEEGCLVFCEVKTRKSVGTGEPEEQVTRKRQKRYIRCAQQYCQDCSVTYDTIRFDIIAVRVHDETCGELRFIPNAFGQ